MGFRDRREPEGHAAGKDSRDFRDKSERLHTASNGNWAALQPIAFYDYTDISSGQNQ